MKKATFLIMAMVLLASLAGAQVTSVLWGVDGEEWDPTGQLRDFTTDCGYQGQGAALPSWPVWTNLTDLGATVDDDVSDVDAFRDAIANCPPYHAIYLPNGTYVVDEIITLSEEYDNIVIRGESRDGAIIYFSKHMNEIQKVAQSNDRFFQFIGGTNRGIENVSFIFRDEQKATGYINPHKDNENERHWFYSGEAPISFTGGEKNSWMQNVYIKNANHAIMVGGSETDNITILDIVLDQFNGRTMEQDATDGHMGITIGSGARHCLVHNILFTGHWAHELAIMGTKESVFSRMSGPNMELDHHANGNDYNLFTEIDKGKGDQYDGEASNNTLETYWGIKGALNRNYLPTGGFDKVIGINTANPTSIGGTGIFESSWHHETIDPNLLEPANIWLAQMAYLENANIPADRELTLPPSEAPYRLLAADDAAVEGGGSATNNFGWSGTMAIKKGTIGGVTDRRGFMKFDLSGLGLTNVAHATLRFYAAAASHSGLVLDINAVSDDSWSERTLTYNNMPAAGALVAQTNIPTSESRWYDIDLTSHVNSELTGDRKVSLAFSGSGANIAATGIRLKDGADAAELIVYTDLSTVAPPTAPTGLAGTPGDNMSYLDWSDNVEDDFASYNVYRSETSGSNYVIWAMGLKASDFFDHTVTNDSTYYYTVSAVDTAGTESLWTSEVAITPTLSANNAPVFTSDPVVKGNALSGWLYNGSIANDADDWEDDPMSFSLVSAPGWLSVATNGSLSGTPGLGDVGTSTFTVQVDARGGSDTATLQVVVDADTTPPSAPTGLAAMAGDSSVSLNWVDNGDGDFASYTVYRSTTSGSYGAALVTGLSTSDYIDNTAVNDTTYYYVVTAVDNSNHESAQSSEDSATPLAGLEYIPPAVPTGLAATRGNGSVALDWTDNSESDLDSYSVYRSTTSGGGYSALATGLSTSAYTDTAVVNETTYYYVLTASDFNGNESAQSSEVSATPSSAPPPITTAITPTYSAGSNVDLTVSNYLAWGYASGGLDSGFNNTQLGAAGPSVILKSAAGTTYDFGWNFTFDDGTTPASGTGTASSGGVAAMADNDGWDLTFTNIVSSTEVRRLTLYLGAYGNQPGNDRIDITVAPTLTGGTSDEAGAVQTYSNFDGSTYHQTATAVCTIDIFSETETDLVLNFRASNADGGRGAGLSGYTLETISTVSANQAPAFTSDPIVEADADEDVAYSGSVADNASDPDSDPMTFSKVSGSAWLSVAANGELSGTPANSDVGLNSFTVEVSDGNGGSDTAALKITVVAAPVNQAPVFTSDPISEAVAAENFAYAGSIADNASDPDSDPMTFSKVSGPAWLSVASNGGLSGTPANSDVGLNSFTVQVDATGGSDSATLEITVANVNDAPVFSADPIIGTGATEDAAYAGSIAGSATDIDVGESLSYSKTAGPVWLSVAANGDLSGVPANGDVGLNSFTVEVSDGNGGFDSATLEITVANVNDAPVFSADPIIGNGATEDAAYIGSIAGGATDDDNDPLSYSKTAGPAWLSVAANGDLSGTPLNTDVGANNFTVSVSDGTAPAVEAALNITVVADTTAPNAPLGLSATAGAASVTLDWDDNAESDLATYTVYRSETSGSGYVIVASGLSSSETVDSSVVDETTYYYVVTASDDNSNESAQSTEVSATPSSSTMMTTAITQSPGLGGSVDLTAQSYLAWGYDTDSLASGFSNMKSGSVAPAVNLVSALANTTDFGWTFTFDDGASPASGTDESASGGLAGMANNEGWDLTFTNIVSSTQTRRLTVYLGAYANVPGGDRIDITVDSTLTGGSEDVLGTARTCSAEELTVSGTLMTAVYTIDFISPTEKDLTLNFRASNTSGGRGAGVSGYTLEVISGSPANQAPAFTADPVGEAAATEDAAYSSSIADNASDPESDPMTFSKVSGPTWLSVATDGTLSGTPVSSDIGLNSFTVQVDATGGTDSATLEITVDAAPDTTPPTAPSGLSALAGIGEVDLDWDDNAESDLASYTVYRSTTSGSGYATVATGLSTSDFLDDSAAYHTTYYYVVTATDTSSNESAQSAEASAQPGWVANLASSDVAVLGTAGGLLADIDLNDDAYQTITEELSGNTSALEHKWVFNVLNAELVTVYLEAHHTANAEGDDFVFAYSTDDVNYTDMITVTKTADDDTVRWATLPGSPSGTLYIRVLDADRTDSNTQLDTISIDSLFIVSEESSAAPAAATAPAPADSAADVALSADLIWTAGVMAASHDVYFGTSPSPAFQGNQTGASFDPGTLLNGTIYYWAIDEVNNRGTTAGSVWSFTTVAAPNNPPAFTSDPVVETDAEEGTAYSGTIADNASDPESDTMSFSKVSGPSWLSVASNGALGGTPGAGDTGLNSFTVQVDAQGGIDTATLEITVTAAPAPPAAPSSLSATAIANTQIDLGWTDNAGNETGFKIERSTRRNDSFSQIATAGANVTFYSDTTVRKGTTYYYRVRATNADGDSAYSNEANTTTPK